MEVLAAGLEANEKTRARESGLEIKYDDSASTFASGCRVPQRRKVFPVSSPQFFPISEVSEKFRVAVRFKCSDERSMRSRPALPEFFASRMEAFPDK